MKLLDGGECESSTCGLIKVAGVIASSLTRPIRLLLFHPALQAMAALSAVGYGILYLVLTSFASLWTDQYGQSVEISGLHYLAIAGGEIAGSQVGGRLMDRLYERFKQRRDGDSVPEWHLPLIIPAATVLAAGLFFYGWAAHYRLHWAVVDVAIFIAMFGGQAMSNPLQAYAIDCYPEYASSATAAKQLCASLAGFGFPIFAPSKCNCMCSSERRAWLMACCRDV
jgi:MFS family permease